MATNFPNSLDSLTNPTSTDALNSPSHADQHANVNDAVEALEAKVGVNGSAVTTSLDYKVENGVFPKLNVDSGVLFVDATNNRVGVNTASPTSDLTVSGSTTLTGDLTVDTTTFKVDSLNNRVGVGTSSPTVALDVVGAGKISGDFTVDTSTLKVDSTNNRVGVNILSPSYTLDVGGDLSVDTGVLRVDATNNRVGVNTLSPTVALDVIGAGSITADFTVDSGTLKVDSTNNRVGVNNSFPTVALDVTGDGKISGDLVVDTTTFRVDSTNNKVGINAAYPNATLEVQCTTSGTAMLVTNSGTGNSFVVEDSSFDSTPFVIDSGGNVGIQKTTPSYPLDNSGITRSTDYIVGTGTKYVPRGIVALSTSTTQDTSVTSTEEVEFTVTFTAVSGRYYKVTYFESYVCSTASCVFTARIRANNLSGTQYALSNTINTVGNIFFGTHSILEYVGQFTAGSNTIVATMLCNTGSGQLGRTSGQPSFLCVEDLGTIS